MYSTSFLLFGFAALAAARTDLSGCVSSVSGASLIWYVPGTGEVCEFLDCGGGRAPPKTTVPGCAAYEGTATYSPSFIQLATETPPASETSSPVISGAESTSAVVASTTSTGPSAEASSSSSAAGEGSSSSSITEIATLTTTTAVPVVGQSTSFSNTTVTTGGAGGSGSGSGPKGNPTTSAPANSITPNSAAFATVNGVVGIMAAAFAFAL